MSKFDILFQAKEFISVKVHLSKVRERETMDGQYLLSNGKMVDGVSYNNNDLSGTLEFLNNDMTVGRFQCYEIITTVAY